MIESYLVFIIISFQKKSEKASNKAPPTEKPPPPPPSEANEESEKNRRNLLSQPRRQRDDELDKQEQAIIASIEFEEREHKKYMDTVNAMRNLSPVSSDHSNAPQPFKKVSPTGFRNVSPALSGSSDSRPSVAAVAPIKKKSSTEQNAPVRSAYNQQHWLIQEAEQRRITEQQMRSHPQQQPQQQPYLPSQSPVYENSNYVGGLPVPHVPPPNQVICILVHFLVIFPAFHSRFSSSTQITRGLRHRMEFSSLHSMRTCTPTSANTLLFLQISKGRTKLFRPLH